MNIPPHAPTRNLWMSQLMDPDPLNFPLVNFPQFPLIHPWFWWDPLTIQGAHHFEGWRWGGSMDTLQFHTCETAGDPIPTTHKGLARYNRGNHVYHPLTAVPAVHYNLILWLRVFQKLCFTIWQKISGERERYKKYLKRERERLLYIINIII